MFRLTYVLVFLVLAVGGLAQSPVPEPLAATVKLQYPNTDIQAILDLYESLTRKTVIRPNQVVGATLYIVVPDPVPREEAIKLIESTLLINGFTLVPSPDGKTVKVFGNGVSPRTGGIPIIADPELIPDHEQVISYLFKLEYADPLEVSQSMQASFGASAAGYTALVPLPKSRMLLVTESSTIIRGLLKLVKEMDLPPAKVVSEWITLERADAKEVLEKLKEIFEKQPSQTGAPGAAPVAPGAPRVRPATTPDGIPLPTGATLETVSAETIELTAGNTLTEDAIIVGKIKISADTRTNRIHVITRPVNIKFVRDLVKEFDLNLPFGEPAERALKFVTASDVLDSVIKAIQDPGAKDSANTTGQGNQQNALGGNRQNATQNGLGGNTGSNSSSTGGASFSEELSTNPVDTVPKAIVVGSTRIIADTRTNKIIVLGNKEVKDKIFKLLDRLDVRAPQVSIHAVIGQLELTDKEQFGVDYILKKGGAVGFFPTGTGTTTGTTTTTTNNTGVVTATGLAPTLNLSNLLTQRSISQIAVAGGSGLSGFFTAGDTLNAIVTALENTNRFRVTARPHIFTSNNKKAIIASGQEIAVPTQSLTTANTGGVNNGDNASVSSSIQFKKVALQLEVVPLINSEREVTLDILQKVDEISGSTRVGGNDIPTISTRYIKTTVSVPNEATIILGGLIQVSDQKGYAGIPYLSKIPVLGTLFRTTSKSTVRRELVILIRPSVTISPDESVQAREREQEFLKIEPDIEGTLYPTGTRRGRVPPPAFRGPPAPSLVDKTVDNSAEKPGVPLKKKK